MKINEEVQRLIEHLKLQPHPEGGYYAEIYRSQGLIPALALADTHSGYRRFMTSIYFLLVSGQVSKFHRLKSDEVWYHHSGSSLSLHMIFPDGSYCRRILGNDLQAGQSYQIVVPAATWFGATVDQADLYSLVGCAVAPGFEFADFELADRAELLAAYPQHTSVIGQLT